ncbi:MAG: secretin N-terminal domain-containing protein, partial [Planctomycetota bacterium]
MNVKLLVNQSLGLAMQASSAECAKTRRSFLAALVPSAGLAMAALVGLVGALSVSSSALAQGSAVANQSGSIDQASPAPAGNRNEGNIPGRDSESTLESPSDLAADDRQVNQNQSLMNADTPEEIIRQAIAAAGPQLGFNFSGTSWRDVLDWYVEQADLSLQVGQYPPGSVNYVDPTRKYSINESLDLLNRLLLDKGWALVRRGRMLTVIDLELENADKLIAEISEQIAPSDLGKRSNSDIVTTFFPMGSFGPDAAKEELSQLISPFGDLVVLESANQVRVTDTALKLRAIQDVLDKANAANSSVIEIVLEHRGADEVLELARPLLGLEPGENVNDEIKLSVGLYGARIFAIAEPNKLAQLQAIIRAADKPLPVVEGEENAGDLAPEMKTYAINGADIATVFDVLQTLLAGIPDTRIAIEPNTNSIIARARPETHKLVLETIQELEGSGNDFAIIDLKRLEPSQALLTINRYFGVTEEGGEGPIVDGDPTTGRLWVKGTKSEVSQVRDLIEQLEGDDSLSVLGDKVRLLPYSGRAAEDVLSQLETLWPLTGQRNAIRRVRTSDRKGPALGSGLRERRIQREPTKSPDVPTTRPFQDPEAQPTDEVRTPPRQEYLYVSDGTDGEQTPVVVSPS